MANVLTEPEQLSGANTRQELDRLLRTDADFEAFCQDYFPEAKRRFSDGMDRVRKQNILFELYSVTDIANQLMVAERFLSQAVRRSIRKRIYLWISLTCATVVISIIIPVIILTRPSEIPISSLRRSCDAKDNSACKRLFERALRSCQHRDSDECVSVGTYYQNELGTTKNSISAASYYRLACEQGNPRGCNNLGLMLLDGKEIPGDIEQAFILFQRACVKKQGDACNNLGRMYYLGQSVPQDYRKAADLFQLACSTEGLSGCISLASVYYNGQGVKQDKGHALEIYNNVCERYDHGVACFRVGEMYDQGVGITKNRKQSVFYYQKSCIFGQAIGCYNAAVLSEPVDPASAVQLYDKACASRHYRACSKLGRIYKAGNGVKADVYRAVGLFRDSCEHGEGSGCVHMGILLELGQGLPRDIAQAADFYQRGCDSKVAAGCFNRARLARRYKEVELSPEQVRTLQEHACTLGDQETCIPAPAQSSGIGKTP